MSRRGTTGTAWLGTAAGCLLLALFATFPLVATPLGRLVGHPDVDVTNHAWGPWWWWITLGRGDFPWHTTLLAAPDGGVLWFIDPFLAAVGSTVVGIVGAVGAYNLVILLYVALAAAGGRALARAFGAGAPAAWIAAAAVAVSPYLLSEVHNGVSEAVGVCWSTFALAATRRALAGGGGGPRRWLVAGLWLGAAASGTWYYGLATGITMGAWALTTSWGPSWRQDAPRLVGGAAFAGAVGVVVALPVLGLVRASIADPRSLIVRGDVDVAVREFLLAHNAVDPRAFVAPFGFQSVDLAAIGESFLHSSYLGLVALALVAVAVRARPSLGRVVLGLLPAAVLSLGAYLWWGDGWVTVGSSRFALPFAWLVAALPDAGSTHAQRLVWPLVATVAALAAVGAERLAGDRRGRLAAIGALVVVDLLLAAPWPLARVDALDLRTHATLGARARDELAAWMSAPEGRERPARGVLDLPTEVGATMATSRYLVYQTASDLPIPYRVDARGQTARIFGAEWFNLLVLASAGRPEVVTQLAQLAQKDRVEIGAVSGTGVRWIVLHREMERGAGDIALLEAQLRAWFGDPEELGDHLTWDVNHRDSEQGDVLIRR